MNIVSKIIQNRKKRELIGMAQTIYKKLNFKECYEYGFIFNIEYTGAFSYIDSRYITSITIDFDNMRVLDSKNYIPGPWENVLKELYDKCPIILEKKRQKEEQKKEFEEKKKESFENVIKLMDLVDNEILTIDSKTTVKKEAIYYTGEIDGYESHSFEGNDYYVHHDGKEVLKAHAYYKDNPNYWNIKTYIPGPWEEEIIREKNKAEYQKRQNSYIVADEKIKKLRKIK